MLLLGFGEQARVIACGS